jgi:hypothetical protein
LKCAITQNFWASTSLNYVFKKIKGAFAKWPLSTTIVVQFWTSLVQSRTWNWIKQILNSNLNFTTFEYFSFNKIVMITLIFKWQYINIFTIACSLLFNLMSFLTFFPMFLLYKESLSLTSVAWWLYLPLLLVKFVQQNGKSK